MTGRSKLSLAFYAIGIAWLIAEFASIVFGFFMVASVFQTSDLKQPGALLALGGIKSAFGPLVTILAGRLAQEAHELKIAMERSSNA